VLRKKNRFPEKVLGTQSRNLKRKLMLEGFWRKYKELS
jgi:hypothetical protein